MVAGLAVAALLVLVGIGVWGFALGGFSSAAVLSSATTYVVNSSGEKALYCTKTYNENGVLIQAEYDEAALDSIADDGSYASYTVVYSYSDAGNLLTVEKKSVAAETLEETYELQTYAYEYDEDDNPVSITLSVAEAEGATASEAASAELEYDAAGRVEAFTVTCLGDSDSAGDFFYSGEISYTEDGRVSSIAWRIRDLESGDDLYSDDTGAYVDGAQVGWTVTYEYDADGNLEAASGTGWLVSTVWYVASTYGYYSSYYSRLLFAPSALRDGLFNLDACACPEAYSYLLIWAPGFNTFGCDSHGTICSISNSGEDSGYWFSMTSSYLYQCEYDEDGNMLEAVYQRYNDGETFGWYEVTYFEYR